MDTNRLEKWEAPERKTLARRLRRTVHASPGYQKRLWDKLLQRLEGPEEGDLTTTDAAREMGVSEHDNCINIVNQTASRLRRKVRDASKTFTPDPHAYLSLQTYEIRVSEDPPAGWKQDVGPSIGLLLADAADGFVGNLIRGVIEVCDRHAFDLLIDVSTDDPIVEVKKMKRLLERTHGLLIVPVSDAALDPGVRQILRDHDCVLIDRYLRDLPDVPCVHPDDISAGRQAGLYLKECGCSRVLIVDQASRSPNSFAITPLEDRAKGCKIQLRDQGLVRHLPAAGSDEQGGFDALERFEQKDRLTTTDGIFALTDRLAVGCKHYLATRQPPLEIPVIGTEGQSFGDFMNPALVSIRFDDAEMGRLAATVLFANLQEGNLPQSACAPHYLIPPVLLKPSTKPGQRERIPITFPDAASFYSVNKMH